MQLVVLTLLFCFGYSKIYFIENADEGYQDRWLPTKDSSVTLGVLSREPKRDGPLGDYCLKMMNDSSYYRMSAAFAESMDLSKNNLFLQFEATYSLGMDCGGSYFKFYSGLDNDALNGDSPYSIMFGPDVCGYGTRKVHLILNHKGTNYELKNSIPMELDSYPHFYQLYIGTDGKFSVKVDAHKKAEGTLEDSFGYLPPKEIDDPNDKKPEDWVDEEMMDDPEEKKSDDWDDRRHISDENAVKPSDWDDATDGEWEPDLKVNPNYKGDWAPKKIPNPSYKGLWKASQIPNPDYKPDDTFAKYSLSHIAYECWTVKSNTEFDNILVTDDEAEAKKYADIAFAEVNAQVELIKKAEKEKVQKPGDKPEVNEESKDSQEPESGDEEGDSHEDL